jgi:hypothetical protein
MVWIEDNDANFVITGGSVTEGHIGSLLLARKYPNTHSLTVPLGANTGTAASGSDFTAPTSVVIPAGQTTVSIPITALPDNLVEPDETVALGPTIGFDADFILPASATLTTA